MAQQYDYARCVQKVLAKTFERPLWGRSVTGGSSRTTDLYDIVHWIVDCYGRFAANVGRIELASAIFAEEFGALLAAIFK